MERGHDELETDLTSCVSNVVVLAAGSVAVSASLCSFAVVIFLILCFFVMDNV